MKTKLLLLVPILSLASCASGPSPHENRTQGTLIGAALGGLGGAAIGNHNQNTLAGAAIGTAAGAVAGAAIGEAQDKKVAREQAERQERAWETLVTQGVTPGCLIGMLESQLPEEVIITHIETTGLAHPLEPEDLVALSQAGVPDSLIQAMQRAPLSTSMEPVSRPLYRETVVVERHHSVRPPPIPRYHFYFRGGRGGTWGGGRGRRSW